ncbi:TraB/GumN family protein [Parashewanella curva]|uniref:TraB/GumN family protein n=1 Tax=Parashewanella curva TaxID=2338552 RepID=A0A3L8PTL2_9GAMM|nr:TraB/GumN family protein [Parashewanella curva]RLV58149.1 TraB/GumN family protein [Parashewanella curva]
MNRQNMTLCGLMFTALIFCTSAWAKLTDTPPFYKVEYQGKTAFLLGSVHLGKKDFYPLPKPINQAFIDSETLVVEALPDDKTTSTILKAQTASTLPVAKSQGYINFCELHLLLCQAIEHMPMWIQATQITLFRLSHLGYHPNLGIDMHFINRAKDKHKAQLESMEYQLKLLNTIDKKAQLYMLEEAISTPEDQLENLFIAWRKGDSENINSAVKNSMSNSMLKKLLWQRNKPMSAGIIRLMKRAKSGKSIFVVIGAGHLESDHSVNHYLKQAGAKVESVWRKP